MDKGRKATIQVEGSGLRIDSLKLLLRLTVKGWGSGFGTGKEKVCYHVGLRLEDGQNRKPSSLNRGATEGLPSFLYPTNNHCVISQRSSRRSLKLETRGECLGYSFTCLDWSPLKNISIWVVVKIMVPFWVPIIIRPLIFRVPKKGP